VSCNFVIWRFFFDFLSEKHFALVVVTFLSQVGDFSALLCVCFAVSEEGRAWKTDVK
jgi:hypothetical protein